MSDCGGISIAALAAPLVLVVLLIAGVTFAALRGAQLVGNLALEAIDFAGSKLVQGVKSATLALQGTSACAIERIGSTLADSAAMLETMRTRARRVYESNVAGLQGSICSSLIEGELSAHAVDNMARARALQEALRENLPLQLVAENQDSPKLQLAESLLAEASSALRSGNCAAAQNLSAKAESLLAIATRAAHERLVQAERAVIAVQGGAALRDLGYEVRAAYDDRSVGLVGRKADRVIALAVEPGGKLSFDMAGFLGSECEGETKELFNRLGKNGLRIGNKNVQRHGCISGGPLIQRERAKYMPLETALAQLGSDLSASPEDSVRRPTKITIDSYEDDAALAWVWGVQLQKMGVRR